MGETEVLSPEKERQILRGAAAIFGQDGYEGASMARIAACAGVSKGTLYNYFEGKAELFKAWVGRECEANLAHLFDTLDPEGEAADGLRAIGERMIGMMSSETGLTIYRLTVSEAAKFPELARAFFHSGPERALHHMMAWLERQADAGHLAIPDTAFAADQFFALCQTRASLRLRLGLWREVSAEELRKIVDGAVEMFLNTYGVRP